MISGYTKSEICSLYRQAKNKQLQITILTQLTASSKHEIEKILIEGGCLNQMTDLVKERILQLYDQGLSDKAISRELKVSQSQVSPCLRGLGKAPNGRKFSKKNEIQEEVMQEIKPIEQLEDEDVKAVQPEIKPDIEQKLKAETLQNVNELKAILPKSIPKEVVALKDEPVNFDIVETLTPQQYYELAKMTINSLNQMIEIFKTVWEA